MKSSKGSGTLFLISKRSFAAEIQRLGEAQTQTERALAEAGETVSQTGEIVTRLAKVTLEGFKDVNAKINALVDSQIRTDEKLNASQMRTDEKFNALADSQMRTDEKFNALADSQMRTDEKFNASQARTDEKFNALADSQMRTDQKINALENSQMRPDDDLRN